MASICCSSPDMVPLNWLVRFSKIKKGGHNIVQILQDQTFITTQKDPIFLVLQNHHIGEDAPTLWDLNQHALNKSRLIAYL
jgi:hypothetical protein